MRVRLRDKEQMRMLRDQERRIRDSLFWRGKPDGAEAAVKRLYLTGSGDCGGPMWSEGTPHEEVVAYLDREREMERRFEETWLGDPERAKAIDWRRFDWPGDGAG